MTRKISSLILAACVVACIALFFKNSSAEPDAGEPSTPPTIGPPSNSKVNPKPAPPKPVDARLVAADNAFGFTLFSHLLQSAQNKNILVSPLSITTALAMAYNGASGATKTQMAHALQASTLSSDQINAGNAGLRASLISADPNVELTIANSLWARRGVDFQNSFLDTNRKFYQAEIASLDFNDPQAVSTINGWVSKNTKGKIPRIVDRIDAQTMMFLINAIYFKGKWQKPFDKAQTKDGDFYLAATKKRVPMMTQGGEYSYFQADDFSAVALPYGNGRLSLYMFLPDEKSDLSTFLKTLNADHWDAWMNRFKKREGSVTIPRFKMDYEQKLNDALKALGMTDAFDSQRADFSAMRPERDLYVSLVKHDAVMEVNEEGTEAAAATVVGMSRMAVMVQPEPPFTFLADRPFFCAIRDNFSGAVLFMGALRDPQSL